jgi:hypothetical protein
MEIFKLIIPLTCVPNNGIITKINGKKEYTVKKDLRIYTEGEHPDMDKYREIKCDEGFVFLISSSGDINACMGTREVCWHANRYELQNILDELSSMGNQ